jgi:hypothetical protein
MIAQDGLQKVCRVTSCIYNGTITAISVDCLLTSDQLSVYKHVDSQSMIPLAGANVMDYLPGGFAPGTTMLDYAGVLNTAISAAGQSASRTTSMLYKVEAVDYSSSVRLLGHNSIYIPTNGAIWFCPPGGYSSDIFASYGLVDGWFYIPAWPSSGNIYFFSSYMNNGGYDQTYLRTVSGGNGLVEGGLYWYDGGSYSGSYWSVSGAWSVPLATPFHLMLNGYSYSGGTYIDIYLNGVLKSHLSTTVPYPMAWPLQVGSIGNSYTGNSPSSGNPAPFYCSEIRMVCGMNSQRANFTPPTLPYGVTGLVRNA